MITLDFSQWAAIWYVGGMISGAQVTSGSAWYKGGASCDTVRASVFLLVFLGAV